MKPFGLILVTLQSLPALAMTPVECETQANAVSDRISGQLGSDGCNFKSAGAFLREAKIDHDKCIFTLSFNESGTQVQCAGKEIPGPGYVLRKALLIRKFRRACKIAGFSKTLYQKTADGQRSISCKE